MPAVLTVPVADTSLHVEDTPGGAPALVLINGAFGTLQNWDNVAANLGGRYRVIRFKALDCPAVFVRGSGGHPGASAEEMRTLRDSAAVAEAASERVSVFATAPCNHVQLLNKCADVVASAIEDVIGTAS